MKLFDKTLNVMERSLDVRLSRQNVLHGNLANVDTPGYVARDVNFDNAMKVVSEGAITMQATQEGHFSIEDEMQFDDILAEEQPSNGSTIDGNTVDLDRTMAALSENATQYSVITKAVGKKLGILKYIASDGFG